MHPSLQVALDSAAAELQSFRADPKTIESMGAITDCLIDVFQNGGKLLTCGNGGSMADAMHVAEEFSGRFRLDRPPLGAIALSDPAHLSCVANDYGYEFVFSRQAQGLGRAGDAILLMTTSGTSVNLLLAADVAKNQGMTVIGALGRGGGLLTEKCDLTLHAPGVGSDRIQELHMLAFHAIIEAVELALFS